MRAALAWLVAALPFDAPSRRAIAETMNDWAHEEAEARSVARRAAVWIWSLGGIVRAIVATTAREMGRIPTTWVLPRVAVVGVLPAVALAAIGWGHGAVPMPATSDHWIELTSLVLPQTALALLPLALFVVIARRPARRVPGMGLAVAACVVVLPLAAWGLPAASRQFHVSSHAIASTIEPASAAARLPFGPGDLAPAALVADAIARPGSPAMGVLLFRAGLILLTGAFVVLGSVISRVPTNLRRRRVATVVTVYALAIAVMPSQWEMGGHAPAFVGSIPWCAAVCAVARAIALQPAAVREEPNP